MSNVIVGPVRLAWKSRAYAHMKWLCRRRSDSNSRRSLTYASFASGLESVVSPFFPKSLRNAVQLGVHHLHEVRRIASANAVQ